jgi:hypothetical protein
MKRLATTMVLFIGLGASSSLAGQHDFEAQKRLSQLPTAVDVFRKSCLASAPDFQELDVQFEQLEIWADEEGDQVTLTHAIDVPTNMYGWRRGKADRKAGGDIIIQYVEGTIKEREALGCLVFGSGYSGLAAEDNLRLLIKDGEFLGEEPAPTYHFGREGTNRQWQLADVGEGHEGILTITNFIGFGGPDSSQITLEVPQLNKEETQ